MSCTITLPDLGPDGRGRARVTGSAPKKPTDWRVEAWFISNGEKNTHSALLHGQTLAPSSPASAPSSTA